jgi:IclR family transcriptional regulator, acetate operon repressor
VPPCPMRSAERDDGPPSVVGRVFQLVGAYGPADRALTIGQLAARTGIPKPTVHRLAGQLLATGALERTRDGYRLGMRMFELGQLVPLQRDLREAALPFLQDLYEAAHETAHLAVLDGTEVLYIEKISGRRRVRTGSRIGGRMPAHCTAVGKAILAFSPPEAVAAVLDGGLPPRTPFSITVPGVLKRQLATIARTGVAYDREEADIGVTCAAAPVFAYGRRVVAGISVTGLVTRLDPDRLAPTVLLAALGLSRQLSGGAGGQLHPAVAGAVR